MGKKNYPIYGRGAQDLGLPTVAVVLCLHGAAASKYLWLMPEPLKGILQVAVFLLSSSIKISSN